MERIVARVLAIVLLLAGLAQPVTEASAGTAAACRGIDGSFLQLTRADALRPRADWERLFADMAAVGVAQVFVQWTLADGVAFYAQDPPRADDVPMVDLLLALAEQHGMRVWLGLAHDAGWWAGIDRARPANEVDVFLARRRLANLAVARALAPAVAGRPSFAGWYVPDEVDDRNWLDAERTALVADYLATLGRELAPLAPGAGIAVSGFAQGWGTPGQVAALWGTVAARAPLTLLLFQDGIGARKLGLDDLPAYLPRLRAALDPHGKRLGVVVELFDATSPEAGTAFAAVPAPLGRVERQLGIAWREATGPVVGFSVPDYLSPFGGAAAGRAYAAYRDFVGRCTAGRGARPRSRRTGDR
ncbi:MAG: DUF4434 domain-containing protein [bacterium]|nr:DUF4434 domain-containing protein [bacterium]